MNNKEEAEDAWKEYFTTKFYLSTPGERIASAALLSDFKAALIQAVQEDKISYIEKRDLCKEDNPYYLAYDLAIGVIEKTIRRINETKPL